MARYNLTVPDELADWLDDQDRLSPSGLLQDAIKREKQKEQAYASNHSCPECGEQLPQDQQ